MAHSTATISESIQDGDLDVVTKHLEGNLQESEIQNMIDTACESGRFSVVAEIAQRYRFTSGSHFEQALFDAVLALANATTEVQESAALAAVNALLLAGTPTTYYRQRDPRSHQVMITKVPTSYLLPNRSQEMEGNITITYWSIYDLLVTMKNSAKAWVPFLKFAQHKEFKHEKSREAKLYFPYAVPTGIAGTHVNLTSRTLLGDAEQIAIEMRACSNLKVKKSQKENSNQNFRSLTIAKQGGNPLGAKPIVFDNNDPAFNQRILQEAGEQYKTQKNIFKEILGYFAKSYRPTNNDYKTRFEHFAGILAQMQMQKNTIQIPQITEQELKRFRATNYCLFTGSQRYLDLIKELQDTDVEKLTQQYNDFARDQKAYLKPKGSYFQLAEKIVEASARLSLNPDSSDNSDSPEKTPLLQ